MRGEALGLMVTLLLVAGCLQPAPEEVEAAAVPIVAPSLLSKVPRALQVPAGDSYAIVKLETVPEDWTESDGMRQLMLVFETSEDAESSALAIYWAKIEDGTIQWAGSNLGMGGGGGGGVGWGTSDEVEPITFLAFVAVIGASAPFDLRVGVVPDFSEDLHGEPTPADVLRAGEASLLAAYFEFGSYFDAVFPSGPMTVGFEVDDSRVRAPPGTAMLAAGGQLDLSFAHEAGEPTMQIFNAYASSFQGSRAGLWSAELDVDGETEPHSGAYADPAAMVWLDGLSLPQASAATSLRFEPVAETFPITVAQVAAFPFVPSEHGYKAEAYFDEIGVIPLRIMTPHGCIDPAAPAIPAPQACYVVHEG